MTLDNKISFIGGFILTAASTITIATVIQTAIIGLVGGFFGLLGKEIYYAIKNKIKSKAKAR
jgi:hypothetical protein